MYLWRADRRRRPPPHSSDNRGSGVAPRIPRGGPRHPVGNVPPPGALVSQGAHMKRQERDALRMTLIAIACALLMVLPLVTTFDDLLTVWALQLGAGNPLQTIVPVEARMVVSVLGIVGVHAAASGSQIVVWDPRGSMHALRISWNCIGWQSLILLAVSFMSGLRRAHPLEARAQIVIIGVAGTMLLNLLRVAAVAVVAVTAGQTAAGAFPHHGGPILINGLVVPILVLLPRLVLGLEPLKDFEAPA